MSVHPLPPDRNGRERWQIRVYQPGETGRHKETVYGGRRDAEARERALRVRVDTGVRLPGRSRETFRDYAEGLRTAGTRERSPLTELNTERRLRLHVYPVLGDLPISGVRASDWRALERDLLRSGLARSTREAVATLARSVLLSAVEDGELGSPPFPLRPRRPGRDNRPPAELEEAQRRLPTGVELAALLAQCEGNPDLQAAIVVMAGTGARVGEVAGLSLEGLDMLRRRWQVGHQVYRLDGRPVAGPPKSDAGRRTIPLPDVVLDAVAARLAARPATDREVPWLGGDRPFRYRAVLESLTGRTLTGDLLSNRVSHAAGRAGMPWLHAHLIRAWYATTLEAAGLPRTAVKAVLGHGATGVTERHYLTVTDAMLRDVAAAVQEALARDFVPYLMPHSVAAAR